MNSAAVTIFYENLHLTFKSQMKDVKEKMYTVEVPVVQRTLSYSFCICFSSVASF